MNPDELRDLITAGDVVVPFTVRTTAGNAYPVTDRSQIWFPPGFDRIVAIAVPRRALAVIRLEQVAEVTCEEHATVG